MDNAKEIIPRLKQQVLQMLDNAELPEESSENGSKASKLPYGVNRSVIPDSSRTCLIEKFVVDQELKIDCVAVSSNGTSNEPVSGCSGLIGSNFAPRLSNQVKSELVLGAVPSCPKNDTRVSWSDNSVIDDRCLNCGLHE